MVGITGREKLSRALRKFRAPVQNNRDNGNEQVGDLTSAGATLAVLRE